MMPCDHLQVHNKGVRDIKFSHNGMLVLAADDTGAVKISRANLAPVQTVQAHELVRYLGLYSCVCESRLSSRQIAGCL
jgi:hypothetical protein